MRFELRLLTLGLLLSFCFSSAAASATRYRWRKSSITVSVSTSITTNTTNIAAGADISGALDRSISSWQQAAAITLKRVSSMEQNVSPSGNQGDGISLITIAATAENVAMFPKGLDDATARTRIFYDARGYITEADIVLNPYLQFSTDGTPGTFDLESTLTHEFGHLLGLGHSPVIGSTMNDNYGKNGVYNLPAFAARTLASDDIAAIRSIYGPADTSEDCCGRIVAKLNFGTNKPANGYTVWAEDSESGRVMAAAYTSGDGSVRIGGLPLGKVRLYAQNDSDMPSAAIDLGDIIISTKQPGTISKRIERAATDLKFDYLGFNGQLAGMAVPINAGSSYFLIAGFTDAAFEGMSIQSSSDLIFIQPRTTPGNFSKEIRTLGFEAAISPDAPAGEYSISLRSPNGERRVLIGGLTIEKFPNFWVSR